jgi:hypothetical protein
MEVNMNSCRKEMTVCQEGTETEPDPGMMRSTEEHQEIPKGGAVVMPVGEPRKRSRVRNLAVVRLQKQKERTRGNHGSRRKSAAACRKVFRHAKMTWRKRNIARIECSWASVVQEIQRGWTFGRGCQQEPECSNCIRSRGVEQHVHRSKGKKTVKSFGGWGKHQPQLESMGNSNRVFRKTIGMEFVKRANWTSSGLQRLMDQTLWRGRTAPKWKKKLQAERSQ